MLVLCSVCVWWGDGLGEGEKGTDKECRVFRAVRGERVLYKIKFSDTGCVA